MLFTRSQRTWRQPRAELERSPVESAWTRSVALFQASSPVISMNATPASRAHRRLNGSMLGPNTPTQNAARPSRDQNSGAFTSDAGECSRMPPSAGGGWGEKLQRPSAMAASSPPPPTEKTPIRAAQHSIASRVRVAGQIHTYRKPLGRARLARLGYWGAVALPASGCCTTASDGVAWLGRPSRRTARLAETADRANQPLASAAAAARRINATRSSLYMRTGS